MVVDVNKEQLTLNKLICEKKETIIVQGDMIVPDAKPDILNTIDTSGIISIYKKEVLDGKVRIDGNINIYIMYLADNSEDKIRGINTNLDFSENFVIPECKEEMKAILETNIKIIECKVLNGRKINVKATVETKVKVFASEETNVISEINNSNIQTLKPTYKINTLVGNGETKTYLKETMSIDNTDNLAEILKANVRLVDKDIKVSYNKILAKAEAEIQIMYLTEDNRVSTVTGKLPIVGFVDIQNVSEDNICDSTFEIKNIIIKPNSIEDHSIYVEMEIEILCQSYEEKELSIIEDLYSICSNLEYTRNTVRTMANKTKRKEMLSVREKVNVPEIGDNRIINVEVTPVIQEENRMNTRVKYQGELSLLITYTDNSSIGVSSKNVKIPFEFTVDNVNVPENTTLNTEMEVKSKDFIVQSGGDINCNVDVEFGMDRYDDIQLDIIDAVNEEEGEDEQDYSVVIYVVKSGDTLWKIAKQFKSTVDDIARVNGIEDANKIIAGEKLYIPKTVRTRASLV